MKLPALFSLLTAITFGAFLYCSKDINKNTVPDNNGGIVNNGYNETFKKTGWISDSKYRAVIYILTYEECSASTREQIEEKIKYEAVKHLQAEMNTTFNHNQNAKARNLLDNFGLMSPYDFKCSENNIFYFDIEKKDLKLEFQNIKNTK